ncbi:MAG: GNAT family N-acetyltransferase [Treponema sp.]|jgi:GNAT superfamily N-acetyltransferase|nr:GNAT family N-acetyltransferase [Treponema sp.]
MNAQDVVLRFAGEGDIPLIMEFIRGLAEYEDLLDQVSATEEGLRKALFEQKLGETLICEYQGAPAGFALYFHNFSTFTGKPGVYIEDLFVKPAFRGKGLGKLLLARIAEIAVERDCGRLEWACLNWNEPSIAFYKSQGALPLSEWTTYRVTGEALRSLAKSR